jgi:hypothetical protein
MFRASRKVPYKIYANDAWGPSDGHSFLACTWELDRMYKGQDWIVVKHCFR